MSELNSKDNAEESFEEETANDGKKHKKRKRKKKEKKETRLLHLRVISKSVYFFSLINIDFLLTVFKLLVKFSFGEFWF